MKNTYNKKGFTLTEILIVSAIIGLLVALVGIPQLIKKLREQKIANTWNLVNAYGQAAGRFEQGSTGSVYPITSTATAAVVTAQCKTGSLLGGATPVNFSKSARFDTVLIGAGEVKDLFYPSIGNRAKVPDGYVAGTDDMIWNPTTKKFEMATTDIAVPPVDWSANSRLICQVSAPATVPSAALGANFRLPENNMANLPASVRVVAAVIKDVPVTDAYDLAKLANENLLDAGVPGSAQNRGRIVFAAPAAGATTVDVYCFLSSL